MVGSLPVINLSEAKFECIFGRGCDGVCCQNGRPGLYPEEVERLAANFDKFLPHLRPEARALAEHQGHLSRRTRHGLPARVFATVHQQTADGEDSGLFGGSKPQYVDFDSPLSLMALEGLLAGARARTVFEEMLREVEKGEAQGIIAWHPDRLARNSIDGGRIIYLLDTGKLRDLRFATFGFENNSPRPVRLEPRRPTPVIVGSENGEEPIYPKWVTGFLFQPLSDGVAIYFEHPDGSATPVIAQWQQAQVLAEHARNWYARTEHSPVAPP